MTTITVTAHDKAEWSRMAKDAYATGRNFYGHRYSAAASIPEGASMRVDIFDGLQINYRAWLVFGWSDFAI